MTDNLFPSGVPIAPSDRPLLMDQYKLAVELWDRTRARRQLANSFYVTINSLVIGAGWAKDSPVFGSAYICFPGIAVCVLWVITIWNYGVLSNSKLEVIKELETQLPSAPFRTELTHRKMFLRFTRIERCIPVAFIAMYLMLFLFAKYR
jgi:hypothetical protein